MNDDCILREKAGEAIRSGKLPTRRHDRMFGGPGGGGTCPVCAEPLKSAKIELELEFKRHDGTSGSDIYHLHFRCYAAWEFERSTLEAASGGSSSDQRERRLQSPWLAMPSE